MSIYALKPRFQSLLRPLVLRLASRGVTANQVTLAACLISVGLGLYVAVGWPSTTRFLLIPLWMGLRMAINAIDGMLAREFGQKSPLGAYLNELTDVIADTALLLPFALLDAFTPLLVAAVAVLSILSEYAGVLGLMVGASRRYDGPMGKSDRAAAVGVVAFLIAIGVPGGQWLDIAFTLLAALALLTAWRRGRSALEGGS